MNLLIEAQYFGCIAGFTSIYSTEYTFLEKHENFQKMSYRNRCQIQGASDIINLSIPLVGGRDTKAPIIQKTIDYTQNWPLQHWRTLESCYNKSAFFLYYSNEIKEILFGRHTTLWSINIATHNWVRKKLGFNSSALFTNSFEKKVSEHTLNWRNKFSPANRTEINLHPYHQVFSSQFETNLSILDLLFNLGPQAKEYLKAQFTQTQFF